MKQALNNFLGLNQLSHMKTIIAAVIVAAILQFVVCQPAFSNYSGKIDLSLMIIAILGWIVVGFNAPNGLMAFCGCVALGIPSISYSMLGYGVLEMGGFLHAFAFGGYGFICYKIFRHFKKRVQTEISP
jgi:hypothetical protein